MHRRFCTRYVTLPTIFCCMHTNAKCEPRYSAVLITGSCSNQASSSATTASPLTRHRGSVGCACIRIIFEQTREGKCKGLPVQQCIGVKSRCETDSPSDVGINSLCTDPEKLRSVYLKWWMKHHPYWKQQNDRIIALRSNDYQIRQMRFTRISWFC